MKTSLLLGLVAATLCVTQASDVHAQETLGGVALSGFEPAPAGDTFFAIPSAHTMGHLTPRAVALFDYGFDPLVFGDGSAVVSGQGILHANLSLTLFDRMLIVANVSGAVVQSGDSPTVSGVSVASPDGAEMGDIELTVRSRIYGADQSPFQLGLGASVFIPTQGDDSLVSEGTPRLLPRITGSGRSPGEHAFVWSASAGWMLRGPENPHTIVYGGAVGVSLAEDLAQLSAELIGATLLDRETALSTDALVVEPATVTSLELLFGGKLRLLDGLTFGAAGGPGLTRGVGTPTARVVGLLGWAPGVQADQGLEDDDGDRIQNRVDACPAAAGVEHEDPARNGCPPPDRDGDKIPDGEDACPSLAGRRSSDLTLSGCPADYDRDGVPDSEDACPNQAGVSNPEPRRNGCPGDQDGDQDGIADRSDACPLVKGSRSDDPARHGCPKDDGDGDGIPDESDACPSERGAPSPTDLARHGCPRDVRVTTSEIVILRQVLFHVAEARLEETVDPVSDDLLTEVRDVIVQHPEIARIEVQGHADDTGTAEFNRQLSEARARAVLNWLVKRGVDANRLTAKGYGATRPIASNQNEDGRQKNRRVQFVIIEKR